jgi:hypothetical protein
MGDISKRGQGIAYLNCAGKDPACKFNLKIVDKTIILKNKKKKKNG